jgi:hypothetical protein
MAAPVAACRRSVFLATHHRPLVIPEFWSPQPPADRWTTVMTWDNFKQPIETWGRKVRTKEMEFSPDRGASTAR